jgi:hypothetical protein
VSTDTRSCPPWPAHRADRHHAPRWRPACCRSPSRLGCWVWSPSAARNQPGRQAGVGPRNPDSGRRPAGTTGRRTGLPRRTPVCDGLDGETFWLWHSAGDPPAGRGTLIPTPHPGQGKRAAQRLSGGTRAHPRWRRHAEAPADPSPRQSRAPALHMHHQGAQHNPADSTHRSGYAVIRRGAASRAERTCAVPLRRCLVRSAVGPGRAVQFRDRSARTTSPPRAQ